MDKISKATRMDYGIQWYKVKEKNSGINIFLENLRNKELEYLVKRHHPVKGQFWGIANLYQIVKMIKNNTYLYEILSPDDKKKVYFDIDATTDTLEQCKNVILEKFKNANLQISGYKTPEKYSFHIVLSNYYVYDPIYIKHFANEHSHLGFDTAVYGKYNLFKCINQSKPKKDANIQKYLEGSQELTKHLVLFDFDNNATEVKPETLIELEKLRSPNKRKLIETIDLLQINKDNIRFELPEAFDYINALAEDKLKVIPLKNRSNNATLKHDILWKILVWAKSENINFNVFWEWCKLKENSESRKCRYLSYWEAADRYNVNESFIDTLLFKFYPFLKEDNTKHNYRLMNDIQPTHILTSNYLESKHISSTVKTTYLNIPMGGNKTGAVIDFLNQLPTESTILFISPRIALSKDILGRMNQQNLNFELYSNITDKKDLKLCERLIISINSIYHLADTSYDYIILDEIETTWSSFKGDAITHGLNVNSNWIVFTRMLETSKKIIVMDALLSRKTLRTIGLKNAEVINMERGQEPRTYIEYKPDQLNNWFSNILEALKNKEKIIIFMPYKQVLQNSKRHILTGIREMVKWICESLNLEEDVDVIGYYAEQKKQKNNLININEIWGKAKCIIANTCIAVGNNYSGGDFNKIFSYFSNWLDTREYIQFLYRVRNPIDKTMHIYYEKCYNKGDIYSKHRIILDDLKFKQLKDGFFIEDKATAKMRLEVIMKKCNITKSNIKLNDITKKLVISQDFRIKYTEIPNIDTQLFKKLINDIDSGYNSLIEKLSVEKYIIKSYFKECNTEILEMFFNEGYEFIKRLEKLSSKENIINEILINQNYPEFFKFIEKATLTDISTLKMPKIITNNMIKKCFNLKNEITDRNIFLVSRIFNAYFNKRILYPVVGTKSSHYEQIIIRKLDNKRVIKYCFDDSFKEIVKLYTEYSKKYNKEHSFNSCLIKDDDDICLIEDDVFN
jgi:hypothetical protein